eukprot:CAMPEP_0197850096 /NCGR_PEP_ID=MMETSP1438-20131217/14222_1 /TAXON_ID=1461541 /ORGANISM="Pterosperma sp., Strain CCMP1384" /LENGTH=516 /DNA_ID=CAMNT_0043463071 /DNA_START=134 /DNA_END=1680 /DNA_ORIENTATION=-
MQFAERRQVAGLKDEVSRTRIIMYGVLVTALLFCVTTFSVVMLVTEESKEYHVLNSVLSEKSTAEPVSVRDHEAAIRNPLNAESASNVRWLNIQGYDGTVTRQQVLAFQRLPAKAVHTQLPPHEDGFHYFFLTKDGTYAGSVKNGNTVFTPVEGDWGSMHRTLLQEGMLASEGAALTSVQHGVIATLGENAALAVASGDLDHVTYLQAMFGNTFQHSRVKASVDHLYGISSLNCPAGTVQLDEYGVEMEPVCANFAETQSCLNIFAGWYDLGFSGRCLDLCFYYSPTETCGDGYWTCVPHGIGNIPDAAGIHDTKFFCEPDATCAFPRCEHGEGSPVSGRWVNAVDVIDGSIGFNIGEDLFNKAFNACGLVEYFFDGVPYAYYSRETEVPPSVSPYQLFTTSWTQAGNVMHNDFEIYSHLGELQAGNVTWEECNFVAPGEVQVGFPKDCGPSQLQTYKWFSFPDGEAVGSLNGVLNSQNYGFRIFIGDDLPCGLWNSKLKTAPSPPPPSPPPPRPP